MLTSRSLRKFLEHFELPYRSYRIDGSTLFATSNSSAAISIRTPTPESILPKIKKRLMILCGRRALKSSSEEVLPLYLCQPPNSIGLKARVHHPSALTRGRHCLSKWC